MLPIHLDHSARRCLVLEISLVEMLYHWAEDMNTVRWICGVIWFVEFGRKNEFLH